MGQGVRTWAFLPCEDCLGSYWAGPDSARSALLVSLYGFCFLPFLLQGLTSLPHTALCPPQRFLLDVRRWQSVVNAREGHDPEQSGQQSGQSFSKVQISSAERGQACAKTTRLLQAKKKKKKKCHIQLPQNRS